MIHFHEVTTKSIDSPIFLSPIDSPIFLSPIDFPILLSQIDSQILLSPIDSPILPTPIDSPIFLFRIIGCSNTAKSNNVDMCRIYKCDSEHMPLHLNCRCVRIGLCFSDYSRENFVKIIGNICQTSLLLNIKEILYIWEVRRIYQISSTSTHHHSLGSFPASHWSLPIKWQLH